MNNSLLATYSIVYIIAVISQSKYSLNQYVSATERPKKAESASEENNTLGPSLESSSKLDGEISIPTTGVLNSFENVTYWAEIEERIFKLLKTQRQNMKGQIKVLEEYFQQYKAAADKNEQHLLDCLKSPNKLKGNAASEAPRMYYLTLNLLNKLIELVDIGTDLFVLLGKKGPQNLDKQFPEHHTGQVISTRPDWPNFMDLEFAMHSLTHIQEFYSFDYDKLPIVLSPETRKPPQLNAFHLNEIGMHALYREHYAVAIEWLEHSVEKSNEDHGYSISSMIVKSNLELAVELHNEILSAEKPSDTQITDNLFENLVSISPLNSQKRKKRSIPESKAAGILVKSKVTALNKFNAICSGKDYRTNQERSSLHCWYDTSSSPARAILPYKKELLSSEPEVVQVYDFIGDKLISNLLQSRIKCAWMAHTLAKHTFAHMMRTRTASICWTDIPDLKSFLEKVSSLTLTDLTTNGSFAPCQLIHYLFGRFHTVHVDALQTKLDDSKIHSKVVNNGDRLISVLFYLNDVLSGGATAFPTAGIAALPVKGSAVIWKNVYRNGTARMDTWHGGCPVVYGHKQTGIVQVHSNSQFLTYPCTLNSEE